jgi:serine/threonine-protein kinase
VKDEQRVPAAIRQVYRLEDALGRGASGEVLRAVHRDLERPVVLKLVRIERLHPEWRERVRREARLLARLDHPRLVQLLDQGEADGWLYMAFPSEGAQDLAAAHAARGLGGEDQLRPLLVDVLEGLEVLHAEGVVHRDLKPANVLVDPQGRAQIIDLGLAKDLDASYTATASGVFLGTPLYASPARILGDPPTPRDDLYALGVLAYELVTGANPFQGDDLGVCLDRHLHFVPPDPRQDGAAISPGLASWILAMMAKDPADRPESATAAREWLQRTEAPVAAGTVALGAPAPEVTPGTVALEPPAPPPSSEAAADAPAPEEPPPPFPGPARALLGLGAVALAALVGYQAQRAAPATPPPPLPATAAPASRLLEVPGAIRRELADRRPDLPWPREAPAEVVRTMEAVVEVASTHLRVVEAMADRRAAALLGDVPVVIRGMVHAEYQTPSTFTGLREDMAPFLASLSRARVEIGGVPPSERGLLMAALLVVLDECWLLGPALGLSPPPPPGIGGVGERLLATELRVRAARWVAWAEEAQTRPWLQEGERVLEDLEVPAQDGPWDEVLRAHRLRLQYDLACRLHKHHAGVARLLELDREIQRLPPGEQVALALGLGERMLERKARSHENFAAAQLAARIHREFPDAPRARLLSALAEDLADD